MHMNAARPGQKWLAYGQTGKLQKSVYTHVEVEGGFVLGHAPNPSHRLGHNSTPKPPSSLDLQT